MRRSSVGASRPWERGVDATDERRTQGTPLRERKMFQEQSVNKNTVSFLTLHLIDWYFFDLLDILLYKSDNCA